MAIAKTLSKDSEATKPQAVALELRTVFGGSPLLPGELAADYRELSERVIADTKPRGFIEIMLVRDVIDLTLEIIRLRRLKTGLLNSSASRGVREILRMTGDSLGFDRMNLDDLASKWGAGDTKARAEVCRRLLDAGLTMDDVMGQALAATIDPYERIDRMIASAEARRNNAFREIDRHRASLGAAVRAVTSEAEDAEFTDAETGETHHPAGR